ncbi:MAG: methionine aminotransferase [Bacteroidetes bacterium 4572_117]|nr:MAG: methionine aminotransferase [Bacteroidetes bacterium 4572_117]
MVRSKLPNIGTSIFAVMSEMANKYNALNLSQGFPDFNPSDKLVELVSKYMKDGFNQYAPMAGVMKLREKIAEKTEALYGHTYSPETEITITSGATEAIYSSISAFVQEGDEVIIFEPAYDSYAPIIKANGGSPVYVAAKLPDYRIDWDEVNKIVNARTRMIIINTPHNPTGSVLSHEGMKKLCKLVAGTNIMILSDEVYEHIVFDDTEHQSVVLYPELIKRSIVISSFGKTYHTTGWKVGYCLALENITKEIRKIHQFNVFSVNTPVQYALADFMDEKSAYLDLAKFYEKQRDEFLASIEGTKFKYTPSKGTYFQLLDYSAISNEKDVDFANRLVTEFGIVSVPVSAFYHDAFDAKVLRFCFAKSSPTLKKAGIILQKISN